MVIRLDLKFSFVNKTYVFNFLSGILVSLGEGQKFDLWHQAKILSVNSIHWLTGRGEDSAWKYPWRFQEQKVIKIVKSSDFCCFSVEKQTTHSKKDSSFQKPEIKLFTHTLPCMEDVKPIESKDYYLLSRKSRFLWSFKVEPSSK